MSMFSYTLDLIYDSSKLLCCISSLSFLHLFLWTNVFLPFQTSINSLFQVYLFIWLLQVLVAARWDLVPWPEIKPRPPALGVQSLSHWTTREVPNVYNSWLDIGYSFAVSKEMSLFCLDSPSLFCRVWHSKYKIIFLLTLSYLQTFSYKGHYYPFLSGHTMF